jgi:protein phosphatase
MLCPGDRILLCTDGIHDNLTDVEIEEVLRARPRTTVAKALMQQH